MGYNNFMKKRNAINTILEVLYFVLLFGYLLIIKNIYSVNVEYDFKVFIAFALLIVGLGLLVGSGVNKYLSLILGSIYTLYLVAQKTYYNAFSSYFRFSTVKELASEVAGQTATISTLFDYKDLIPFIVLLIITILFLVLRYGFKCKVKYRWYIRCGSLICFGLSFFLISNMVKKIDATYTGVEDNFMMYQTDYYLYDTVSNPETFVKRFGLLTYGYRDSVSLFEDKKNALKYEETLNEYYSKDNVSETNAYTGYFKGKSLLIIQAESLNNYAISQELTPTLYRLKNSGFDFTNFDTPLLIGSTSDSEFMANTSFIPEAQGYSVCYQYVNNTYPLMLGNLFKSNGYKTNAFHNNYKDYYNRDTTFNNYGYDFFDCVALGKDSERSDIEISDQIGYIDCEIDKFVSFWISYSGHSPYYSGGVGVNLDNLAKVEELYPDLDESYACYIAKNMDLDAAVEQFLNVMDWSGRLDDVVILVYGDHISKSLDYSSGSNFEKVFGSDESLLYTPMFIYGNNMEHIVVDKYCTALDILPTVMNLWDINYDSKYAFGNDILSDSYDGFSFDSNGNCWNNNFYYDSLNNSITTYNGYSDELAYSVVNEFNKKREICKETLKIDYFKKVGD